MRQRTRGKLSLKATMRRSWLGQGRGWVKSKTVRGILKADFYPEQLEKAAASTIRIRQVNPPQQEAAMHPAQVGSALL